MKLCPRCGAEVPPPQKSWCSARCRQDAWRERNREYDLALKRKYAAEHREERKASALARYYREKPRLLAEQKVKYQQARLNSPWLIIFNAAKARATHKGLSFDLTHDWIKARWTGRCELSGIAFVFGLPRGTPRTFTASIDRIEASKGYVQNNCRIILQSLNAFKGEATDEEMLGIARAFVSMREVSIKMPHL